jgi:hypothetical protein
VRVRVQYFFSTLFNREEVMTLLEHLWSSALDRLLSSSSSATAFSSPQAYPAPDIFVPSAFPSPSTDSAASSSSATTSAGTKEGAYPGTSRQQQTRRSSSDLLLSSDSDLSKPHSSPSLFTPPFAR